MITGSSAFAQLLSLVDRNIFKKCVALHGAERSCKGFSCWDQFVAMSFCQMAGAKSLREICGGLCLSGGRLRHLGMTQAPNKSTLSYANANRPWQMYEELFQHLLEFVRGEARKHGRKFRFKNKLYSLDASVISLCAEVYDWAKYRTSKGAVKLHMLLDHDGYLPCWCHISEGKVHDVNAARLLELPAGSIVAMDRGYVDFALFDKWTKAGVYFVTRTKTSTKYEVEEVREVAITSNIFSDDEVSLSGTAAKAIEANRFRVIRVYDHKNGRWIELLTNIMHLSADTIGRIYKERWQIELFFKALKQNFRIKSFVGTSENAVRVQIWTALISILLLKYLQLRSQWSWSFSNLVAFLRMILLRHIGLWQWLDDPFCKGSNMPPGDATGDLFEQA